MGLFDVFRGRDRAPARAGDRVEPRFFAASPENPSTSLSNPAPWLEEWMTGAAPGRFGPSVNEKTAMACSAVFRCVSLLSGLMAGLPLKIYRRTGEGREAAPGHKLQPLFQVAPYPGRAMTAFTWRELWGINGLLWGNHYSVVRYDRAGRIVGFEPVMPWQVEVYRQAGRNKYRCTLADDDLGGAERVEWIDQADMLHIPGIGFDGVKGVSRIRHFARDAVALARLLEEQTGIVHENAARPSAYVTLPQKIGEEGFKRLRQEFDRNFSGRANAGKVIFGDSGTTFTAMQMTPEDLNTIKFRGYQVADISRFFGTPLHLLNEMDKATSWGTGLSEQTLAFLIYTIDPDLARAEAEINYKLFAGTEFYAEFDRDALMAMDPAKAAEVAAREISSGTLLINEHRRKKNRPPVEGGDQALINSTNVPLKQALAPKPPAAVPPPPEEPADAG